MPQFDAILLGFVQGATEFIPVSSSAHLILAREFLGVTPGLYDLAFDAVLQLASVLAVIVFFWKDLGRLIKAFLIYCYKLVRGVKVEPDADVVMAVGIAVGTLPAVAIGLLLQRYMETTFRSSYVIIITLVLGALLMYFTDKYGKVGEKIDIKRALYIGVFQCLALVPGMSRSGSTLSGGRLLGLDRVTATRFSFLLSVPILVGSGLKKLYEIAPVIFMKNEAIQSISYQNVLIGSAVSFVVSVLAIKFLIKYVSSRPLAIFSVYRIALAVLLFVWVYLSSSILGFIN